MPFYIAGVPVLHFFTGSHLDYHRPSDVFGTINFAGAAVVAHVVADLAQQLVGGARGKLTLVKSKAPPPQGGVRGISASLGTIPSYNDDPSAPVGMLVSDVIPGGAAANAGVRAGDRIIKLDEVAIRNVEDLMAVLSAAKPGTQVRITVRRGEASMVLSGTYGAPRNPAPSASR
ncbi:MAG: PDZ domain-containing protein [Myxococcales bacterium]|nr:PDZ domain-containing protein [Myxococcales bacterium]